MQPQTAMREAIIQRQVIDRIVGSKDVQDDSLLCYKGQAIMTNPRADTT